MFCYSETCNGEHKECSYVKNLDSLLLKFKDFITEDDIDLGKHILCLVSSWEEPPYFIVCYRSEKGIVSVFDGNVLENTDVLKWAYLPENIMK